MDWRSSCDLPGLILAATLQICLITTGTQCNLLRITTVMLEPYMTPTYVTVNGNKTGVEYVGFVADLIHKLSERVGFRYMVYVSPDNSYGYRQSDGMWNGMIKELLVKKAHVAAGPLLDTPQRKEVVDFTVPFLDVHATVLIRKPPKGSEPIIRFAKDLVNQTDLKYGTLDKGIIPRSFKTTNDSDLKEMWKRMSHFQPSAFTSTNEQGIEQVRKENYGFIMQDTIGDYLTMQKYCDLLTVDKFLFKRSYALALPKNSRWLPIFNRGLTELRKIGVLKDLYRKWWVTNSPCQREQPSRSISLAARSGCEINILNMNITLTLYIVVFLSSIFLV